MLITIPLHDISCEHKFYKSYTLKNIPFYLASRKLHPKSTSITLAATLLNTTDKLTKHEKLFNIKLKKDLKTEKNDIFKYITLKRSLQLSIIK